MNSWITRDSIAGGPTARGLLLVSPDSGVVVPLTDADRAAALDIAGAALSGAGVTGADRGDGLPGPAASGVPARPARPRTAPHPAGRGDSLAGQLPAARGGVRGRCARAVRGSVLRPAGRPSRAG